MTNYETKDYTIEEAEERLAKAEAAYKLTQEQVNVWYQAYSNTVATIIKPVQDELIAAKQLVDKIKTERETKHTSTYPIEISDTLITDSMIHRWNE